MIIQEYGHTERVPVQQILYFKAELKYVTVRTSSRSYILDGSLNELEEKHRVDFVRTHRNALIARRAVRLNGVDELLAVSRRQLAAVRELVSR